MPNQAAADAPALGGSLRHKAAGAHQAGPGGGGGRAWSSSLPRSVQSVDGGGATLPLAAARRARLGRALRSRRDALTAWWRWWLVGTDMTLIALMPVLVHLSKDGGTGAYPYHPAAVNFMVEAAKTAVAAASLAWAGRAGGRAAAKAADDAAHHPHHPGWAWPALAARARRARALAAPAALYALNGYLKFAVQAHFSPTAARVLGSLKVVAIALLLRGLTGRRFSTVQVQALALMAAGVAVHSTGRGCAHPPPPPATHSPHVAATVAAAVAVPSLAAVLAERAMKADMAAAVQEQTFWLCAFGLAANTAGLAAVKAAGGGGGGGGGGGHARSPASMFAGTASPAIAGLVAVSAAQGVLAGVFYKNIDAIAKKLSSVGATALTAVFSTAFLGQAALTPGLALAALILGIATHQFYVGGVGSGGGGAPPAKGEAGGGGLALTASSPTASLPPGEDDDAARATPVKLRRPLAGMA